MAPLSGSPMSEPTVRPQAEGMAVCCEFIGHDGRKLLHGYLYRQRGQDLHSVPGSRNQSLFISPMGSLCLCQVCSGCHRATILPCVSVTSFGVPNTERPPTPLLPAPIDRSVSYSFTTRLAHTGQLFRGGHQSSAPRARHRVLATCHHTDKKGPARL